MATLRANTNPKSRRETGDEVLSRARSVSTAAVSGTLSAFTKAHAALTKADAAVARADLAARAKQAKGGEADARHDAEVEALASAAAGEGAARVRPFARWKGPAPSALREGPAGACARASAKLAATIAADGGAGPKTKAAAARLAKAAAAVEAALGLAALALEERRAAIARREALEPAWEKAFAVLKRAARAAADEPKSAGLFDALFSTTRPAKKKKPAKKAPA